MPSSQEWRTNQMVTDLEPDHDTQALAVALASSQQHTNTLVTPQERDSADEHEPPPSAQPSQKENDPPFNYHGLQLQSIEDFDREHPYEPKTKQRVSGPPQSSTGAAIQFNYLCQMNNLRSDWTTWRTQEGEKGFRAKVVVGSITEQIDHYCHSKNAAKDAVCQLVNPKLEELLEKKAGDKRKAASPLQRPTVHIDNSENWISILNDYLQKEQLPTPYYNCMPTPTGEWACTCIVYLENYLSKAFGSNDVSFRSKQDARIVAAKEGVVWLRQQGRVLLPSVKRQKVDPGSLPEGQTGLTQGFSTVGIKVSETVPQYMARLIQSLDLCAPTYDIRASSFSSGHGGTANGYWDIAATFDSRDIARLPELAGRIGEVKHVYGKAKAKEACSQKVVQILEKLEKVRASDS